TVDLSSFKKAQEAHSKLRAATSKLKAPRQTSLESIGRLLASLGLKPSRQTEASDPKPTVNFTALAAETEQQALRLMKSRQELSNLEAAIAVTKESIETKDLAIQRKIEEVPPANRDLDFVISRGSEAKKQIEERESFLKQTTSELSLLEARLANYQGSLAAQETEIQTLSNETERLSQDRAKELKAVLEVYPDFDVTKWTCTKDERDRLQIENRNFETKLIQTLAAKEESQLRLVALEKLFAATMNTTSNSESLRAALQNAVLALQNSETLLARLNVESETLERISSSIQSDQTKLDQIKSESERAIRLGGLLSGDRNHNKLAVPLARFVLQSRFEDVLDQANRRLGRMSRGRYLLRRPALSHNLAQSQGLNLSVEDSMTGKERHADSLSGGESFMAALSLALGLADVVQADLGGVKLDSVIIDEGFGTLDSESLDLALRTLVDLQAGGRMVGVISHVQELKSQIDQRLEVIPSPEGSRLRWEADRATPH
ncbi:MAG: SbcC/MukB-like Walker B domain-containing protein, partial [Bdellovibrionales bacterium]|nr:SbcC/MukB-like Walker B domain-containing protein [Bdellovibrionales bacterium]